MEKIEIAALLFYAGLAYRPHQSIGHKNGGLI